MMKLKKNAALSDTINGRSNNSFNASGIRLISIRKIGCCSAMLPAALIRALDTLRIKGNEVLDGEAQGS